MNVKSILALEEQIREYENAVNTIELKKAVIRLKRSRNALLNISTLPPEILGEIFQSKVTLEDNFGGLEEGSHNFLFVCHHWHEVALRTPGVWSFWGNTLSDWARWYRYSATAPLDLVLSFIDQHEDGPFDGALHDTLQDRAARDTIRWIHLQTEDEALLNSVISPLTAACDGVRSNSVESLILLNEADGRVDVSNFFAHYCFPKLQYLNLEYCSIASWGLLTSRTAVLTTLILHFDDPSLTPTTSQLLSILTSNPTLRKLTLSGNTIPNDSGGESPLRVPLHHLKELELYGGLPHVLGLLHRLDHPANMDRLNLTLLGCTVTDIPQTIGPYLQNHLRRRGWSRNGLGLRALRSKRYVILSTGDTYRTGLPAPERHTDWFFGITVWMDPILEDFLENALLDLIAHTPRDDVVLFQAKCGLVAVGDISAQFPNLKVLEFRNRNLPLPTIFPESIVGGDEGTLSSLQHMGFMEGPVSGDWSPLTAFLACRASSREQVSSLTISCSHVCQEVKEHIRTMVQVFHYVDSIEQCPFGTCQEHYS